MGKYLVSQSDLETICLGAITNRISPARFVRVAPSNPENPDGGWELVDLDPPPVSATIDETIEVIRGLQAVFSLKRDS